MGVRINPNGIFGVSSANLVEKHEIEEEVPEEMETDEKKEEAAGEKKEEENKEAKPEGGEAPAEAKSEEKMETSEAKPEEKKEVKMVKRKKVVNKTIDLPISQRVNGQLSSERLQNAILEENTMNNQDRAEAERLTAKNSVEEYILEEDRNKYSLELEDAENWLYEDGEFAEKPEYQKKLSELQVKGEAVKRRRYEFEA